MKSLTGHTGLRTSPFPLRGIQHTAPTPKHKWDATFYVMYENSSSPCWLLIESFITVIILTWRISVFILFDHYRINTKFKLAPIKVRPTKWRPPVYM